MREIISFSTKFESLEKVNPLVTKYRINICVPDKAVKGYVFSKAVIESMSSTVKGAGVYAYYFESEKQLGGHENDIVLTKHGYKRTGEPVAYGFSDPYQEPFWMEKDDEQWYTTFCYLWSGRNPHIEEVLQNPVWQSMEVAVDDEKDQLGNKIVKEALFLGFCLLQGIKPAFEGSTIEKLSLPVTDEEINLLKQEYENLMILSETTKEEGDSVIKEAVEKFSLNSEQIREILKNGLTQYKYNISDYEYNKYYVDCYDAEFVYVWDCEDGKTYRMTYVIAEMIATIDADSKEEVIRGNYVPIEKPAEVTIEEDMSSNEFVDNNAAQELNDQAAEQNKELSKEQMESDEDKEKLASLSDESEQLKQKLSQLESANSDLAEENTKLKEFKLSIEKQNKDFEVETTLKDVIGILPQEEIDVCRMSAENFSLESIDAWKNEVKAKAFNASKNISGKKSYIQVGLPVSNKPKRGSGLWD